MKHKGLIFFILILLCLPVLAQSQVTDKVKLAEFEDAITKGEAFMLAKDYARAKAEYQKALSIDPQAKYPKDKLAQIRKVYIDPRDEEDFNKAVNKGDQFTNEGKYDDAKKEYTAALLIKPDNKQVKEKLAAADKLSIEYNTRLKEFNILVSEADALFSDKKFNDALDTYKKAEILNANDNKVKSRIAEIENLLAVEKSIQEKYNSAISQADETYMNREYKIAVSQYEEASRIKPGENYPKSMLERVKESMAKQETDNAQNERLLSDKYNNLITSADQLFKEDRLNEAIQSYREAASLKSQEKYPRERIDAINTVIAQREQEKEDQIKAIQLAEEKKQDSIRIAEENQKLADLKAEQEKQAQIDAEKDAELQRLENERSAKLAADKIAEEKKQDSLNILLENERIAKLQSEKDEADRLEAQALAEKEEADRVEAQRLAELKLEEERNNQLTVAKIAEERRLDSIAAINKALAEEQARLAEIKRIEDEKTHQLELENASKTDKEYYDAIEAGNSYYTLQDLSTALKMFEKASELKPSEQYPKDRIIAINNILLQRLKNNLESYNKFVAAGDLAFQSNVFDKALEEFQKASEARPDEKYPSMMIERIRKLMADNAIIDLSTDVIVLADAQEKKYNFKPVDMRLRKNNYLLIKAKKTSEKAPKVFINYGKDDSKSGGFVLKGIESDETTDYLLRVSIQDKWYRVDNNWISIYPEGGDIEITSIQISQGDIQILK